MSGRKLVELIQQIPGWEEMEVLVRPSVLHTLRKDMTPKSVGLVWDIRTRQDMLDLYLTILDTSA